MFILISTLLCLVAIPAAAWTPDSGARVDSLLALLETSSPDSPRVTHVDELVTLARNHVRRDELFAAADLLDRTVARVDRYWGSDHESLAELFTSRAEILNHLGNHNEATPLFERALAIKQAYWPPDHPELAGPQLGLAALERKQGRFGASLTRYRRWREVLQRALGPAHRRTVVAAIGEASCLIDLGDYAEAEKILRPHVAASLAANGELAGETGELMLALAGVLAELNEPVESPQLYRRAAVIMERVHGPDHTRTAAAIAGLAHIEHRIGDVRSAELLYRRAIAIVVTKYGGGHPDLIHYRGRVGMCQSPQRDRRPLAVETIENAIALATGLYGADSYQVAIEERHLGLALIGCSRFEEAIHVLEHALGVLEQKYGPDHPFLSKCLKGLARAHLVLEQYETAYGFINRALALHEDTDRDQAEMIHLLSWRTDIEFGLGRWDAALASAFSLARRSHARFEQMFATASAREANYYSLAVHSAKRMLAAFAAAREQDQASLVQVFSFMLHTHGQALDRLAERQRFLAGTKANASVAELHDTFAGASQRLVDLVIKGADDDRDTYLERLTDTHLEMETAERALLAASGELPLSATSPDSRPDITAEVLAAALAPGEALVYYLTFPEVGTRTEHYCAFCLRKFHSGAWRLDFRVLGKLTAIDALINTYREVISEPTSGRRPTAREEAEFRQVARVLYDALWAPLFPDSTDTDSNATLDTATTAAPTTAFLMPVHRLHQLDFNSLLSPNGRLVVEQWKTHLLSSGRDLLRSPPTAMPAGGGLLALGNPVFPEFDGSDRDGAGSGTAPLHCPDAYRALDPLPGAEQEAHAVARIFATAAAGSITVLVGPAASEQAVKRVLPAQRMAHFATHGFVCDQDQHIHRLVPEYLIAPLAMSGLVLAPSPGADDGLFTAHEVAGLDLQALDWVVLSACNSGLGRLIGDGLGLFGLRRAFKMAGARTVLTTLWWIEDTRMKGLMAGVYRRRLAGGATVDAVRDSQIERLVEARRRWNRIHPILWGGIVAEGDWR